MILLSAVDGDLSDRLNRRYTVWLLALIAVIILAKSQFQQSNGSPQSIQDDGTEAICWCPAQFNHSMIDYTNTLCSANYDKGETWEFSNVEYGHRYIPARNNNAKQAKTPMKMVAPWLPHLLLLQAILFWLPGWFWEFSGSKFGIKTVSLLELMSASPSHHEETHQNTIKVTANRIMQGGSKCGNINVIIYLITKVLYLINICLQIVFLKHFLPGWNLTQAFSQAHGTNSSSVVESSQTYGSHGNKGSLFLCDFEVRKFGNFHRHTITCVVKTSAAVASVKSPDETVQILLGLVVCWLYYFVAVCTVISLVYWIVSLNVPLLYEDCVTSYVQGCSKVPVNSYDVKMFVHVLKKDGILVLKLLASANRELYAQQIVSDLYVNFREINSQENK